MQKFTNDSWDKLLQLLRLLTFVFAHMIHLQLVFIGPKHRSQSAVEILADAYRGARLHYLWTRVCRLFANR